MIVIIFKCEILPLQFLGVNTEYFSRWSFTSKPLQQCTDKLLQLLNQATETAREPSSVRAMLLWHGHSLRTVNL